MNLPPNLLHDRRLVDRHIRRGLLTQEAHDEFLKKLGDATEVASGFTAELSSVGVENVDAKDTGLTDDG